MEKMTKIMEKFWLGLTIFTLVFALYFIIVDGFNRGSYYLYLPLIAGTMWFFRRLLRKKLEKTKENEK